MERPNNRLDIKNNHLKTYKKDSNKGNNIPNPQSLANISQLGNRQNYVLHTPQTNSSRADSNLSSQLILKSKNYEPTHSILYNNHVSLQINHSINSQFSNMNISKQDKHDFDSNVEGMVSLKEDKTKNNVLPTKNSSNCNISDTSFHVYEDNFNDNIFNYQDVNSSDQKIYFGVVLSLNDKYGFIKTFKNDTNDLQPVNSFSKWNKGGKAFATKKDNLYFQRNNIVGYIKELLVGDIVSYTIYVDANQQHSVGGDEEYSSKYKKGGSSSIFCKKAENVALLGDICIAKITQPLLGKIIELVSDAEGTLEFKVNGKLLTLPFGINDLSHIQKMDQLKLGNKVFFNIVAYPFPGAQRTAYNVRLALEAVNEVPGLKGTSDPLIGHITSSKDSFGRIGYTKGGASQEELFFHFDDAYLCPTLLKPPGANKESILKRQLTVGTRVVFRIENRIGKEIATHVTPLGKTCPIKGKILTPLLNYNLHSSDTPPGTIFIEHLGIEVDLVAVLCDPEPVSLFHGDTVTLTLEYAEAEPGPPESIPEPVSAELSNRHLVVSSVQLCAEESFETSRETRCKAYVIRGDVYALWDVVVMVDGDKMDAPGDVTYHLVPLKFEETIDGRENTEVNTFEVTLCRTCSDTVPYPPYLGSVSFFTATRAVPVLSPWGKFSSFGSSPQIYVGYVAHRAGPTRTEASSAYRFILEGPTQAGITAPDGFFYSPLEDVLGSPDDLEKVGDLYEQLISILATWASHQPPDRDVEVSALKAARRKEGGLKLRLSELVSLPLVESWLNGSGCGHPSKEKTATSYPKFLPFTSYWIHNFSTGNFVLFRLTQPPLTPKMDPPVATLAPLVVGLVNCQTTFRGYVIRCRSETLKRHNPASVSKFHSDPDLVQTRDNCYTVPIANYLPPTLFKVPEIGLGDHVTFKIDAPNSFSPSATAHSVAFEERPNMAAAAAGDVALSHYGVVIAVNSGANKYKVPFAGIIRVLATAAGGLLPDSHDRLELAFYFKDILPCYKVAQLGDVVGCGRLAALPADQTGDQSPLLAMADSSYPGSGSTKVGLKAGVVQVLDPGGDACFEGRVCQISDNGTELQISPTAQDGGPSCLYAYKVDRSTGLLKPPFKKGDLLTCWTTGDRAGQIYYADHKMVLSASKWAHSTKLAKPTNPWSANYPEKRAASGFKYAPETALSRFTNHNHGPNHAPESTPSLTGFVPEAFNVKLIRQPRQPLEDERGFSCHGASRNLPLAPSVY